MCPAGTRCWRRSCIAACAAHAMVAATMVAVAVLAVPLALALSQRCLRGHRGCHPSLPSATAASVRQRWSWVSASCPCCHCRRPQPHRWAALHRRRLDVSVAAPAPAASSWRPPCARPDNRRAVVACPPWFPSDAACAPVAQLPWQSACLAVRCSPRLRNRISRGIRITFYTVLTALAPAALAAGLELRCSSVAVNCAPVGLGPSWCAPSCATWHDDSETKPAMISVAGWVQLCYRLLAELSIK